MRTAAIYARFSSDLQRATSLEDQVALCRRAASQCGYQVLDSHVYTDSEISGAVQQRSGYAALLQAASQRCFGAVLVESQDRLWRDQGEMHQALKRLRFCGVQVIAVSTGMDLTDRAGKVLATIYGLKDELFLDDLRDKTRRGMLGQVGRGYAVGGRAYGYRSKAVLDGAGQVIGARRVIDPEEAKVVVRIFEMYASGYSPKTIAHMLNDEGVAPPRHGKGKRSLGWTWTTIAGQPERALGILHNPLYIGRLVWNRSQKVLNPDTGKRTMRVRTRDEWVTTEVPGLRIIRDDLWGAVQARHQNQRRTATGNLHGRRPTYLLSGLLECGECGSHLVIQAKKPRANYYGCAAYANRGASVCSNNRLIRREKIEAKLLQVVFDEVFSPETVAYLTEKVNEALRLRAEPPDEARSRKQAELDQARRELENIQVAIRRGLDTKTTKAMLVDQERKIEELEAALQTAPASQPIVALPTTVERYLKDLRETLGNDTDRARTLLAKMVGTVILRRDGEKLVGEVRGNLQGLLNLKDEERFGSGGAGRGI
jgi:site-specific DNA recombinase